LFHPRSGQVRVKGVTRCPNSVLHTWLEEELQTILAMLPPAVPVRDPVANRAGWTTWQRGLKHAINLPSELPSLRMLLILDNLAGHRTPSFVLRLIAHGVMVLYTPLARLCTFPTQ
jgi:hypothetical protein